MTRPEPSSANQAFSKALVRRDLEALLRATQTYGTDALLAYRSEDPSGGGALHVAASRSTPHIARALLQIGADVDALDRDGDTPLIAAALHRHSRIVAELLGAGADPNASSPRRRAATALQIAARLGDVDSMSALLRHGAHVEATDTSNRRALHRAAEHGSPDAIGMLLRAGADPTVLDDSGRSPLCMLGRARAESRRRSKEMIESALRQHALRPPSPRPSRGDPHEPVL